MLAYNYDPQTGEYLGAEEAEPNPLEPGEFLIPGHATKVAPPATGADEAPFFSTDENAWKVVDVGYRRVERVLDEIRQRLAAIGPLVDAYADLDALGKLDADGEVYLAGLRLYRVRLRMLQTTPGFPDNVNFPTVPQLRDVPLTPFQKPGG
jgi:hypothetical protein